MKNYKVLWAEHVGGKRRGIGNVIMSLILYPLSVLYATVAALRNMCYDKKIFAVKKVAVPVISIGNLVVGGTGKTPVTIFIATALKRYGVAVLSRGYRSPAENAPVPVVLSYGEGPQYTAKECGDEPYLLAKSLDDALIIVGKDRCRSAVMAANAGVGLILLDDGMQYRRLARDVNIVVVDANDPLGRSRCLPIGFLREPLRGFRRADLVIANNTIDGDHYERVLRLLRPYTQAPLVGMRPRNAGFYDIDGERVEDICGKKVGIFSGIARPEYFRRQIEERGAHVIAEYSVDDHGIVASEKLQRFVHECSSKGCELVLCTEKDIVKISRAVTFSLPVAWMRIELEVVAGAEQLQCSLKEICEKLEHTKRFADEAMG